jgi:hypothetical protein
MENSLAQPSPKEDIKQKSIPHLPRLFPKEEWPMTGAFGPLMFGLLSVAPAADPAQELKPPVRLKAAGKPIDTTVGHAAPFVGDIDGDGVNDLLVGQFGDGILWIYRNEGSNSRPKLVAGVKFKGGKKDGRVPTG